MSSPQYRHRAVNCGGGSPQTHKTHRASDHVNIGDAWYHILAQSRGDHCGCCSPHPGALYFSQLWWDFYCYMWWTIPPQRLHDLCKFWGRCLPFVGWDQGRASHLGGGYGLWPSYIVGCHERTLEVGPPVLAAALLSGCGGVCGLRCPGGCYLYPVQRHIIQKNFSIHEHHQRHHSFPQFLHTLPTGMICLALVVGPSQPNAVTPWHMPGFFVVVSCSSLGCQITCC